MDEREQRRRIAYGKLAAELLKRGWRPPRNDLAAMRFADDLLEIEALRGKKAGTQFEPTLVLTALEVDLLDCFAHGGTCPSYARVHGLSVETIKTRSARILEKLGALTQSEAVALAVAAGVVKVELREELRAA